MNLLFSNFQILETLNKLTIKHVAEKNNQSEKKKPSSDGRDTLFDKFLNGIEKAGNKLPDPAMLFFLLLVVVWVFSALLSPIDFGEVHPRTGDELVINNLLTGENLAIFWPI